MKTKPVMKKFLVINIDNGRRRVLEGKNKRQVERLMERRGQNCIVQVLDDSIKNKKEKEKSPPPLL